MMAAQYTKAYLQQSTDDPGGMTLIERMVCSSEIQLCSPYKKHILVNIANRIFYFWQKNTWIVPNKAND